MQLGQVRVNGAGGVVFEVVCALLIYFVSLSVLGLGNLWACKLGVRYSVCESSAFFSCVSCL